MIEFIVQRAPYLKDFELVPYALAIAPILALVDAIEGLGIWFLQKWARFFIVIDLGYRLGVGAAAGVMFWGIDRQIFRSVVLSPQFLVGALLGVTVLACLLAPETRRAFNPDDAKP